MAANCYKVIICVHGFSFSLYSKYITNENNYEYIKYINEKNKISTTEIEVR